MFAAGTVCVAWPGQLSNLTAQYTASLNTPRLWQALAGSSPYCSTAVGSRKFYRLVSLSGAESVNYIGYQNFSLVVGSNSIANPFNNANNRIDSLIPSPPDFTIVYKSGAPPNVYSIDFGWDDPSMQLLGG